MLKLEFIAKQLNNKILLCSSGAWDKCSDLLTTPEIQKHLYNLNLLPQYQSSYRANFSTETLLLKLMNDILKGMESQ